MTDNVNVNAKRLGRKRRATGWVLAVIGVLVATSWAASGLFSAVRLGDTGQTTLERGTLAYIHWGVYLGLSDETGIRRLPRSRTGIDWLANRKIGSPPDVNLGVVAYWGDRNLIGSFAWTVALWPIPLPLWASAAAFFRSGILARRRAMSNACRKCGYSLAGLADGAACPECGR
jgi:hypothetical protein